MANVGYSAGSGTNIATVQVTRDAATEQMQLVATNQSQTANNSSVACSTTSGTLITSNAQRLALTVDNNTGQTLYLLAGTGTASATNYSWRVPPMSGFVLPIAYTGQINCIWDGSTVAGSAYVTELVA